LTWEVKNFSRNVLNISITFEDPIQISIYEEKDKIMFESLNASGIFKAVNGYPLNVTKSIEECSIQISASSLESFMEASAYNIQKFV